MLTARHKHALRALQDQASAATALFPGREDNPRAARASLAEAQLRMSMYSSECSDIVKALMASADHALTIPTLTEERLAQELERVHATEPRHRRTRG
jgi:hypothetical protein